MNIRRTSLVVALGFLAACDIGASQASPPTSRDAPEVTVPAPSPTARARQDSTSAASTGSGERDKPDVLLDIPARDHAPERPDEGWCAETAIQEALLYYGELVSQRHINKAGKPRHPDLYWSDVPVAMKALGLAYQRFPNRSGESNSEGFFAWLEKELDAGHPVIAGVKILPTAHPEWGLDHMVLIVGYERGEALYINTTWGYRQRFTRAELLRAKRGISLANGRDRYFAYAIRGLRE